MMHQGSLEPAAIRFTLNHRCPNFFVNVLAANHYLPAEAVTWHAHILSACTY